MQGSKWYIIHAYLESRWISEGSAGEGVVDGSPGESQHHQPL